MFSLKAYIPTLAQYLSVSPDALYEKQRTLIRSGLLVPVAGRGPGSGVKVSPVAVSLLTMSVLSTEGLADIDPSVRRLGSARAEKSACSLSGSIEFGQALEIILAQTSMARRITSINVDRPSLQALVNFQSENRKKQMYSKFGEADQSRIFQLEIKVVLPGFAVWCIASDLHDIADGHPASAIEKRMHEMRLDPGERWFSFFRGKR